ncbi:reticulophagy regulator 3-like isoform X2 [Ylistrum balloti]|uniref:reticulophagy regulator 3-like isoform X2 n=1 Tax=Ylistrum balloti TaxID=509963 RepID=UPI002905A96E|nr:reticulophagy regulator 3-like isoform X2 [Ylistrum balloti]
MENPGTRSSDDDVQRAEDMFRRILNPIEPLVMRIQSLLVWEYPRKSAVLFVCVHGIFWFLAAVGCRFYFVVSTVTYIVYLVQTWKHKIWPEIRVPPAVPEDPDSWTPVHPRLLSVPELCTYLAHLWCSCSNIVHYWLTFRRVYPFLFCVMSSSFFLILAMIGRYIPGIMLAYIIVISTLLCPSVLYHNLLKRVYLKFEPIFMKMDYSIKLKNKWSFKVPRSSTSVGSSGRVEISETDSETEFTPSLDPATTAALARAITDSEDESPDPSLSSPLLSKEPSIDLEDDDYQERQVDFDVNFEEGIQEMPSFDDVLDNTDDELLEHIPKRLSKHRRPKLDDMTFVSEHFGDTSDSEEGETDLNFPSLMADSILSSESDSGGIMPSGAGAFVSKTLSSVVGSALSGISNLKPSTTSANKGDKSNVPASVSYNQQSGDEVDFHVTSNNDQQTRPSNQQDDNSSDIDIGEEFEFLDQYDLEEEEK